MTGPAFAIDYRRRAIFAVAAAAALGVVGLMLAGSAFLSLLLASGTELRQARAAIAENASGEGGARERAALAAILMSGASEAETQAALQNIIKDLARRNGVEITNLQPAPARAVGSLSLSGLQLQATMAESQLPAFLKAMAAGKPAILPSALEILPQPSAPLTDGAPSEPKIALQLDALAYSRGRTDEGAVP